MPSPLRDPKTLAQWIELDYFKRSRKLRRVRRVAIWSALALSVIAVTALALTPGNQHIYQPGPLARAHAIFTDDCKACHDKSFGATMRLIPGHGDGGSVSDHACEVCHLGTKHVSGQVNPPCAICHREHLGLIKLAEVKDEHCTNCHSNLSDHGGKGEVENVRSFAMGKHPEFAQLRKGVKDPGQLQFNHKFHLDPKGISDNSTKTDLKLRLKCADCHQRANQGSPQLARVGLPSIEWDRDLFDKPVERNMMPINYQQHCSLCHKIYGGFGDQTKDKKLADAAKAASTEPAPHVEPRLVLDVMRGRIEAFSQTFLYADKDDQDQWLREKRAEWVQKELHAATEYLFEGGECKKCHIEPPAGHVKNELPRYLPTNVTTNWYKHATFNHHTHRLLDCL